MKKNDKKQVESKLLIRIDKNLHMEAKAQAAYRNQSLQDYVTDAIIKQIVFDKEFQK